MPKTLSSYVLLCQRLLQEKDEVFSAIRMIDVLFTDIMTELPIEKQTVPLSFLAGVKGHVGDASKHQIQIDLVRPDGESTKLGEANDISFVSTRYPDSPGGFNIVGEIGVVPKQLGVHFIVLSVDGEEAARAPFTLHPRKPEQNH